MLGRTIRTSGLTAAAMLPFLFFGSGVIRDFAFTLLVGVVDEQRERRAVTARDVLEHLEVAVGISHGQDRPAPNMLVYTHRLARLVIDEVHCGKPH